MKISLKQVWFDQDPAETRNLLPYLGLSMECAALLLCEGRRMTIFRDYLGKGNLELKPSFLFQVNFFQIIFRWPLTENGPENRFFRKREG